jgi:uncharacterized repeat protein (TIGR01451 family)
VGLQSGFVPGNIIRFYRGLGGGKFAAPVTIDSFPGNAFVVAGQLNAGVDDFLDIAVASDTLNEVRVYFGNGAGGFGPPTTVVDAPDFFNDRVNASLVGFAMGDLNGDPFPDLVTLVHNRDTDAATVYGLLGSASGSFTVVASEFAPGSGFPVSSFAVAQFAGSPAGDVIGIASTGTFVAEPPALGLLIGDGAGGFSVLPIPLASITNRINASSRGLAVGDFDENGTMDVAFNDLNPIGGPLNFTRSFIDILLGDGNGSFTLSDRYAVPEVFQQSIVAADFDGDGHLDIASTGAFLGAGNPGAKVNVAFGNGAGGVDVVQTIWGLAEFPTAIIAADLDDDRRIDLLVSNSQFFSPLIGDFLGTYSVLLNQIPEVRAADLSIIKVDSPDPVRVGGELTYRLRVRNLGPSDATGVIVTDTLPANVDFVSASSGCSRSSSIVTCTIGNMRDGETAVRLIRVRPTEPGRIRNTATVTANETDPNPGDNTSTTVTTVR